jgi:uncharacterized membrane protein
VSATLLRRGLLLLAVGGLVGVVGSVVASIVWEGEAWPLLFVWGVVLIALALAMAIGLRRASR